MHISKEETDFFTSVERALDEIEPEWLSLPGLIVCGTHSPKNINGILDQLKQARESNMPTLGICFGLQMMVVEYARNVMKKREASTEEVSGNRNDSVIKLPELRVGIRSVHGRYESHWHNYTVNEHEWQDWEYTYDDDTDYIVEMMSLHGHPFYVGTQFHPEYGSSKHNPHPILVQFLNVCRTVESHRA